MNRPLSDFLRDQEIYNAYLRPIPMSTYCFKCEESLSKGYHYRAHSMALEATILLCPTCATDAKRDVIQRRGSMREARPHNAPLTEEEKQVPPNFRRLRRLKPD